MKSKLLLFVVCLVFVLVIVRSNKRQREDVKINTPPVVSVLALSEEPEPEKEIKEETGGLEGLLVETERRISFVVVHHSATASGNADIFRRYHVEHNKWQDIGYHFVITNGQGGLDGEIQKGRPLALQGAHARGRNGGSIGICLVGNSEFTDKQIQSLFVLLEEICRFYGIQPSNETIQRHHERCPGALPLEEIVERLASNLR